MKSIKCPFYDDKKASFSIYKKNEKWYFYDHGNTIFKGDCFDFAILWYKIKQCLDLSFYEVIFQLYHDLNLFNKTPNDIIEIPSFVHEENKQIDIPDTLFKLHEIEFNNEHIKYFDQYGITIEVLKRNNVVALKSYEYFDFNSWKNFVCYKTTIAFKGKDYAKIYQPNPKMFVWRGTKPIDYVFGKDQLPEYGNGELVILAAGEKDALSLMSLGYYSISLNSESATVPKNLAREIAESHLILVVLYDIDETGLKYGAEVSKELNCRNIVLPNILKEKGGKDVSDWIKLGLSKELLKNIIDGDNSAELINNIPSPELSPTRLKTMEDYEEYENNKIHQNEIGLEKIVEDNVLTGEDLLNLQIDEIPTLVNPIFQKTGIIAFAGSSDTGKSSFLRQLASAICTGEKEFLGFKINATHFSSIYVSTEDDENSMAVLIRKQNNAKQFDPIKYRNLRYIFDSNDLCSKLDKMLTNKPADLVIIDAYSDIFTGEINQTNKVRTFLEEYSNLAKKYKCLIIFLHHTNKKSEEKEPSKGNLLGSQGFEAKMRMVIELRKDPQDENLRHICIVKGNYLSSDYKTESFELEFSEDMLFESTGNRIPFNELKKIINNETEESDNFESVKELKNQGFSLRQIEEKTGISKSKAGRMLKK